MLGFYKDSQLTLPVSLNTPKRFLLPLKGGSQASSLFIGDPYTAKVTAQAVAGAASITVDQTFELPTPGVVTIGAQAVLYTGKTSTSLTGIPASGTGSIASTIAVGSVVIPKIVYISASTLRVDPFGVDLTDVSVQLKRSNQTSYGFPNTPALYVQSSILPGSSNAVEVDILLSLIAGAQAEFTGVSLVGNSFLTGENLLLSSQAIASSPWVVGASGVSAAANATTAPDGTLTGTQLSITAAIANAGWKQTLFVTTDGSNPYSFILWMRGNGADVNATIGIHNDTDNVWFAGSGIVLSGAGTTAVVSGNLTQINGLSTVNWSKVQVTATTPVAGKAVSVFIYPDTANTATIGHSMFVWDAQVSRNPNSPFLLTTTLPQPGRTDSTITLQTPMYVFRRDQALPQTVRLLPANRQVTGNMPGFILGQYRWRDQDTVNEITIIPTQWDQDPALIGTEKFATGAGHGDDLLPVGLIESNDSIFMQVKHGTYFDGPSRYYLPAGKQIEFFAVSGNSPVTLTLSQKPNAQVPMFVGTWKLDTKGFYGADTQYRYMIGGLSSDPSAPSFQFALDRRNKTVTINKAPAKQILFLGLISGNQTDFFDLPLYPVDRVNRVYIDRGVTGPALDSSNWTFNRDNGSVRVINPGSAAGPSIPTALTGEAVFAEIETAVAIQYETGASDTAEIDTVDINPAFSGLAGGQYYLQHRRQKADTIQLSADKPVISIPPTQSSVAGLTAYGPVYFDGDYALLIAKAFSKVPGEPVSGVRMVAVLDPTTFSGLLNYRNPVALITAAARAAGITTYTATNGFQGGDLVTITGLTTTNFNGRFTVLTATTTAFTVAQAQPDASISSQGGFGVIDIAVVTGGDGTANAVYIPQTGFGYWIPTTAAQTPLTNLSLAGKKTITIANDTLVLPQPIPISQVRNATEGWLVNLYSIESNNPLFGLAGGNPANGEVPFTTTGTAGSVGYRTNGIRDLWKSGAAPIVPIDALDINGVSYTVGGFTGTVKQLKYGQALPTPSGIAAYFVTFLQRLMIQFEAVDSNAISNSVLLQMAVPALIVENPWLVIEDDTQGRINQFRLGWVPTSQAGPSR